MTANVREQTSLERDGFANIAAQYARANHADCRQTQPCADTARRPELGSGGGARVRYIIVCTAAAKVELCFGH